MKKLYIISVFLLIAFMPFTLIINRLEDVDYDDYNFYSRTFNLFINSFGKPWSPINEFLGRTITGVQLTNRYKKFITQEQVDEMKKDLLPGDILLRRLNWQMTNFLISGYWKHSGIYLGNLEKLDDFFSDVSFLEGISFSQYMKKNYPESYKYFLNNIDSLIIETIAAGTVIMPLENMALADGFAALRPKLNKEEIFNAINIALSYLYVPYDYGYDLETEEAVVCSELVYIAYSEYIDFKTHKKLGVPTISPGDIANTFIREFKENSNPKLKFILFYRGNETDKLAYLSNLEEFIEVSKSTNFINELKKLY